MYVLGGMSDGVLNGMRVGDGAHRLSPVTVCVRSNKITGLRCMCWEVCQMVWV